MGVDENRPRDHGRESEQRGDVEDVGTDHDADAGVLVAGDECGHGRRDLGSVGAEGSDDPEQRLGETEALAHPVELPRQHNRGEDGECEAPEEDQDGDRRGHRSKTLAAPSPRLHRRASDRDRRRAKAPTRRRRIGGRASFAHASVYPLRAGESPTPSLVFADVPATVIVGAQWGDEGKGKIVDLLAQESDIVCRYQGGPNAGHTIIADGETFKIRQIPSGILSGKVSVIGAGCVVDPQVLLDELDQLESRGIATEPFKLSGNAHLIMPWHVAIDRASERRLGELQIGTTRRGIGPAYADKASRLGIRVQDLLDPKILRQKIEVAAAEKNVWLERVYGAEPIDLQEVAERYEGYAQRLRPFV